MVKKTANTPARKAKAGAKTAEKKAPAQRAKRTKKAPLAEPVVEPVVEETPIEDLPAETPVAFTTPRGTRRVVTSESIEGSFSDLISLLEEEIKTRQGEKDKARGATGVKFLKSCLKRVKDIQKDVNRVSKKKRTPRQGSNNSGFLKPTLITDEMADFLGVEHGTRMSRVDCTRGINAYVKEHQLQDPNDGRIIFPDRTLVKLLRYKKDTHGPLKFFIIQKLIQPHFVKETPAV